MAYATDLTDALWRLVRDLFDPVGRRGAPARIPRRRMVNAVLYQARTGCQWRYLPGHFGPWGAIWQQLRRWRASGVWEKALTLLRRAVRTKAGRDPEPSMVMLDCQTVKGGRGGPGFHEAGGKYRGRCSPTSAGSATTWLHVACVGYLHTKLQPMPNARCGAPDRLVWSVAGSRYRRLGFTPDARGQNRHGTPDRWRSGGAGMPSPVSAGGAYGS